MQHPLMDTFLARLRIAVTNKDKSATVSFRQSNSIVVDIYGRQSREIGMVEFETDRGLSYYSIFWSSDGNIDWSWIAGGY